MKLTSIKHLAYLMSEAKNEKRPKPIFFLGAGASRSAGIPTAWEIIRDIKDRYSRNPLLQKIDSSTSDYAEYMDCLSPFQRNELLKKYIQETKINPGNSLPLANQGRIYSYMAELETGSEAKSLYEKGIEKYKEALKLNSSEIDSLSGIVHLLIHYSKLLPDSEKDKIYQEALEYTKKVKELIGYSYNLACVYALMNKRKEAFAELSVGLSHAEVSPQHVEGDFEWENFRGDKEFQEILKKYK